MDLKRSVKFNKEVFEVRETGRIIRTPAKSYTDFNGYDTETEATSRKQLALYDSLGVKRYTLDGNQTTIRLDGKKVGSVKIETT